MRKAIKRAAQMVAILAAFPSALLTGFGRLEFAYVLFAQAWAFSPGIVGDYLRAAYYRMTLAGCSLDVRISTGTFFAHSQSFVGRNASIGSYCVLGQCNIGEHSFIGSGAQILSGSKQHIRDESGTLLDGEFVTISIGSNAWIGAGAIVMADVGADATVAAGTVTSIAVPTGATIVGNPGRIVRGKVAVS